MVMSGLVALGATLLATPTCSPNDGVLTWLLYCTEFRYNTTDMPDPLMLYTTVVQLKFVLFGCFAVALLGLLWVVDVLPFPWHRK